MRTSTSPSIGPEPVDAKGTGNVLLVFVASFAWLLVATVRQRSKVASGTTAAPCRGSCGASPDLLAADFGAGGDYITHRWRPPDRCPSLRLVCAALHRRATQNRGAGLNLGGVSIAIDYAFNGFAKNGLQYVRRQCFD